ncbi:MAG: tetratricopeptide repeat protein, partial [Kofleriaceae bacterium]|nr:tetratricopeptide repeat protein [Kofleriaceae bacterium]
MWQDMLEVVDQQILISDGDHLVAYNFEAADLLANQLVDIDGAQSRYATVLDLEQTHQGARAALEEHTLNPDAMSRACEILEPIYASEGNFDALAALYERRIEASGGEDLELFQTLAHLHEDSRNDVPMAFATWSRVIALEPQDEAIQAQVERVTASLGNWQELVALYEKILSASSDPLVESRYATRLGVLYEDNVGDLSKSAEAFERALQVGDDEQAALGALARVYERDAKYNELADTYKRQSDVMMDETVQANLLFMLGDVRENRLDSIGDAIESYRMVLERDPSHAGGRGALERLLSNEDERASIIAILEPLYENDGDSARLATLLRTKVSTVDDGFERAQIYARVTEIYEQDLGDLTSALDAVGGWLAEDAMSDDALAKLLSLGGS